MSSWVAIIKHNGLSGLTNRNLVPHRQDVGPPRSGVSVAKAWLRRSYGHPMHVSSRVKERKESPPYPPVTSLTLTFLEPHLQI